MDLWTGVSDTVGVVTPNSWSLFSHAPVCSFISAGDWFILSKKKDCVLLSQGFTSGLHLCLFRKKWTKSKSRSAGC